MSARSIKAHLVLISKLAFLLALLCSCGGTSTLPPMGEKTVQLADLMPTATTGKTYANGSVCNQPVCLVPSGVPGGRPFIDTWNNIHLFQTFTYHMDDATVQAHAKSYDFVWGADINKAATFRAANSNAFLTYYIPFDRDGGTFTNSDLANRGLAYWRVNHPDWVLYKCDRTTPITQFNEPNITLDITNPEVVQWQIQTYGVPASENGFDGIAADNLSVVNAFNACGFYRNGQWVQRYTGDPTDVQWRTDVLNWATNIQQGLHALPHPIALLPNLGYNGGNATVDPQTNKYIYDIVDHVDGILDEAGFTQYGAGYLTNTAWLQTVQYIQSVQQKNKPYYIVDEVPDTNNKNEIEWTVSSYLMAKEHLSSLFITNVQDYGNAVVRPEYSAPIGMPQNDMYLDQNVYWRTYSGGMVVVNPSGVNAYTVTLNSANYVDLYGQPVSQTLTLPVHSGMVLLKHA